MEEKMEKEKEDIIKKFKETEHTVLHSSEEEDANDGDYMLTTKKNR